MTDAYSPRRLFREAVVARWSGPQDATAALTVVTADGRMCAAAAALLLLAAGAFAAFGQLPHRVEVRGVLLRAPDGVLFLAGRSPHKLVRVGMEAQVALGGTRAYGRGLAGTVSAVTPDGSVSVRIRLPLAAEAGTVATARITVGRQTPLALLAGRAP
jgi:hypothetical protein